MKRNIGATSGQNQIFETVYTRIYNFTKIYIQFFDAILFLFRVNYHVKQRMRVKASTTTKSNNIH